LSGRPGPREVDRIGCLQAGGLVKTAHEVSRQ
jgi:hypothetical protein